MKLRWLLSALLGCSACVNYAAEAQSEPVRPMKYFVNSLGLKMIRIDAEPFDAWTPSWENWQQASKISCWIERPAAPHRVELKNDFYLGQFPVTNGMYRQFVKETGHEEPGGLMLGIDRVKTPGTVKTWQHEDFDDGAQPVCGVHFEDAMKTSALSM